MSWHLGLEVLHVDRARRRRDLHPRRRLVDEVDRLVGQEAPGDVAVGELSRGDDRLVGDRHLVVRLERVAQAAQDHDRLRDRRLRHQHRLEAPLERRVLLDVLLVLVQRRRADEVELAAGERRLERVGDVEPAFAAALAGADDGVDLVDEQHHAVLLGRDLLEDLLDPFLELAAVLRARHHGVDRQLDEALVAERLRHSPATMRWASPSTIAVLPTPGSPISTGLFFLRRASTSIVVSISFARPITGSSLPSRASFVRSREYLSRFGVLVGVSTRPSSAPRPTTFVTCWRIACGVSP